ncbi:hypothetical protein NAPIS_ORF01918, partial [Vairimorpha apis BRL 01]
AEHFKYKEVFKTSYHRLINFIINICVNYLIIFLISYKNENNENKNKEHENYERNNITFCNKMKNLLNNNNLLIATYLLFYLNDTNYYKYNEILYLPFLFYIFMLFMYSKMKYLCGAFRIVFYIVYFFIYKDIFDNSNKIERYMKFYDKKVAKNIKKYILKKFIYEVRKKNYKLQPTNVLVSSNKNSIFVNVCGDILKNLTKKEFTSVLYDEFKHVLIGTFKVKIIELSNYIIIVAAEYLMIYLSRKKLKSKDFPKNCFKIYLLINVTLGVFLNFLKNYIIYLEEIECIKYNELNHDKSYLISTYKTFNNLANKFVK